jgi:hypothetical protein
MGMRFTWDTAAEQYEKTFFAAVKMCMGVNEVRHLSG